MLIGVILFMAKSNSNKTKHHFLCFPIGALGTLTLFGDMLYIALSDSVFHMKKFTSELHGIVYKTSVAVKSVLIWHGHRQPSG